MKRRSWHAPQCSQLNALPLNILHKIEAIMYAGRGDGGVLDLFEALGRENVPATAGQIASKRPLAQYLHLGLLEAKRVGLSLEDDWDELIRPMRPH